RPAAVALLNGRRNLNVVAIIPESAQSAYITRRQIAVCGQQSAQREAIRYCFFALLDFRPFAKGRTGKRPNWRLGAWPNTSLELEGGEVATCISSGHSRDVIIFGASLDPRPNWGVALADDVMISDNDAIGCDGKAGASRRFSVSRLQSG